MAGQNGGLVRIEPTTGRGERVLQQFVMREGRPLDTAWSMVESRGDLWLGLVGGLARLRDSEVT